MSTKQFTREQAIAFYDSGTWKNLDSKQLAAFQIRQDCLCVPFAEFQKAMEVTLGRPVWTHEFADRDRLIAEMEGKASPPKFDEILAQLQHDPIILVTP